MLNAQSTETENKIPDITNLATKAALDKNVVEVESKVPDITNLLTKAGHRLMVKYLIPQSFAATPKFNRSTKISFDAKM